MNKSQFKAAYSKYRAILSGRFESRITDMGTDLNAAFVNFFNGEFGVDPDSVAFVDSGCSYSFKFEWAYGNGKSELIVDRNQHIIYC